MTPKEKLEHATRALMAMGYRRMAEPEESLQFGTREYWGKPYVNTLLLVLIETNRVEFSCWFKGANEKRLLWNRHEESFDNALQGADTPVAAMVQWLKYHEGYTAREGGFQELPSSFEFLTREDEAHLLLVIDVVAVAGG